MARFATTDLFAEYDTWNAVLTADFYGGRWAGRPVYLDVEPGTLERLAPSEIRGGDPTHAFTSAVRATVSLERGASAFASHLARLRTWERTPGQSPPFVALLALFSLAAESMRGDEHFRPNNYYDRLAEVLELDDRNAALKVQRDYRKSAQRLWEALNAWLASADGALGLPTAFAFDWRRHVGLPMSQALVRDTDRAQLIRGFADLDLEPGPVAKSEMGHILGDWLPDSGVSRTLKRLWENQSARERITEVACLELEAWDGKASLESSMRAERRLQLVVQRAGGLVDRLDLAVRVRDSARGLEGSYTREPDQANEFPSGREVIELVRSEIDGWLRPSETSSVSIPDLLLTHVRLTRVDSESVHIRRAPTRVCVLEHEPSVQWFVEMPRIRLGQRSCLLVHATLSEEVKVLLDKIAVDGWKCETADELSGCPRSWTLFSDVLVATSAEAEAYSEDTLKLHPEATEGLTLDGGFTLTGRSTWHRHRPLPCSPPSPAPAACDSLLSRSTGQQALARRVRWSLSLTTHRSIRCRTRSKRTGIIVSLSCRGTPPDAQVRHWTRLQSTSAALTFLRVLRPRHSSMTSPHPGVPFRRSRPPQRRPAAGSEARIRRPTRGRCRRAMYYRRRISTGWRDRPHLIMTGCQHGRR